MGCGCRKNRVTAVRSAPSAPTTSSPTYEVWIRGAFSGRRFTSLIAAQSYAQRTGGEIHTV
jgi:hypothetical protein